MIKLSRTQEREEKRKMNKGVITSLIALLLCWIPVVGFLLAAIGFIGVVRCITQKYAKRFAVSVVAVSLILIINAGVLAAETYAYSRNPNFVQELGTWLLETITGQSADDYNYMGGEDYSNEMYPGLGMNEELFFSIDDGAIVSEDKAAG